MKNYEHGITIKILLIILAILLVFSGIIIGLTLSNNAKDKTKNNINKFNQNDNTNTSDSKLNNTEDTLKKGVFAKLYDTDGDSDGDVLFLSNNKDSFYSNGELIKDYNNQNNTESQSNSTSDPLWKDDDFKTIYINDCITPKTLYNWFSGKRNLIQIENIDRINTKYVTTFKNLFNGCYNLLNVDISNWNSSKVTEASYMFGDCKKINNINLNGLDFSKVTSMDNMFYNCEKIESIDLSTLDTSSLTNANSIFYGCKSLTNLNLTNFNTSKLTTLYQMFYRCESLEKVDVSGFKTNEVISISEMFTLCEKLKTIDISSWNVSKITDYKEAFSNCSELKTIYVSPSFKLNKDASGSSIFLSCEKLVGGANTAWKAENSNDIKYSHIDEGTDNPGYFTIKK